MLNVDFVKGCFDYMINGLAEVEYKQVNLFRPYKYLSNEKLISYFEDNKCFLELNAEMRENIIKEVHYRICDYFKTPYFNIQFEMVENFNEKLVSYASTNYLQSIKIYLFTNNQIDKLPKYCRDSLGLNYLDTIIHETRHSIQYVNLINMCKGQVVPLEFSFIGIDIILQTLIDYTGMEVNTNEIEQLFLNGAEIDARMFTNECFQNMLENQIFTNEEYVKETMFNDNFIYCTVDYLGSKMSNAYLKKFARELSKADFYLDLKAVDCTAKIFQNYKIKDYEIYVKNREKAVIINLKDYLENKLKQFESSISFAFYEKKILRYLQNEQYYNANLLLSQLNALSNYNWVELNQFYNMYYNVIAKYGDVSIFHQVMEEKLADYANALEENECNLDENSSKIEKYYSRREF